MAQGVPAILSFEIHFNNDSIRTSRRVWVGHDSGTRLKLAT
jgi:hypothetical protein